MRSCGIFDRYGIKILFSLTAYPLIFSSYTVCIIFSLKVIKKLQGHRSDNERSSDFQSRLIHETRELTNLMTLLLFIPVIIQLPAVCVKFLQMFFNFDDLKISRMITAIYPLASASNHYLTIGLIKKYKKQMINCICPEKSNCIVPQNLGVNAGND